MSDAERARRYRARKRGELVPERQPGPRRRPAARIAAPPHEGEPLDRPRDQARADAELIAAHAAAARSPAARADRAVAEALAALNAIDGVQMRGPLAERIRALVERCEDLRMQMIEVVGTQHRGPRAAVPGLTLDGLRIQPPSSPSLEGLVTRHGEPNSPKQSTK